MNQVLWVVQAILALAILGAGFDQAANYDSSRQRLAWVAALPRRFALVLGGLEILAAIGLIVPAWLGFMSWLTATTALALVVLMALAIGFHVARREIPQIAFSGAFLVVAAFVAYGRFIVAPF